MAYYTYQGLVGRTSTKGGLEAKDKIEATQLLQAQGVRVVKLEEGRKPLNLELKRGVSPLELAEFFIQLGTLMYANIGPVEALKTILPDVKNPTLEEAVKQLLGGIEGGLPFSKAAEKTTVFKPHVGLLASGEAVGELRKVLKELGQHLERDYDIGEKIKGALTYPMFVIPIAVIVLIVMLTTVVPTFTSLVTGLGGELPLVTKMVIGASDVMKQYWPVLAVLSVGGFFGLKRYYSTKAGKRRVDEWLFRLPIVGPIVGHRSVGQIARNVALMTEGGLDAHQALGFAEGVVDNAVFQEVLAETRVRIEAGDQLNVALRQVNEKYKVFTNTFLAMTKVAEESADFVGIFSGVAEREEKALGFKAERLPKVIEPLMTVVIGLIVLVIVLAMLLPLSTVIGKLANSG